jgi:hypothetical protein
MRTEIC